MGDGLVELGLLDDVDLAFHTFFHDLRAIFAGNNVITGRELH